MRKLLVVIGCLLVFNICSWQPLYIDRGVDTSDNKIVNTINFYRQYLSEIRYDALPDFEKYWGAKDVRQNKIPDPLLYALTSNFPTYLASSSRTVIYVKVLKDYVHLKTLFASSDSLNNVSVTCITNHYISFDAAGNPHFVNPVSIYTKNWKTVQLRNVTYKFPPYHRFDLSKANTLLSKIKKLEKDWNRKPMRFEYYFTSTKEELSHLRGFDFVITMGNRDSPSGMADHKNNIIYASGLGEDYFHEVVHLYLNPQFEDSPLGEGLATFYGGSKGKSLNWHLRYLNEYLQKHPELDLNSFSNADFQGLNVDHNSNMTYTLQGLLCLLAYQKNGPSGLKRIMTYSSLQDIFSKEFNIQAGQWNSFIRNTLQKICR